MSIAKIEIEAYVVCFKCGEALTFGAEYDYEADERRSQKSLTLRINPCQHCLTEAYNEGFNEERAEP